MPIDGSIETSFGPAGQINFEIGMTDSDFTVVPPDDGLTFKIKYKKTPSGPGNKEPVQATGQAGTIGDNIFQPGATVKFKAWARTRKASGWFRPTSYRRIRGSHETTVAWPEAELQSALILSTGTATVPEPWGDLTVETYLAGSEIGLSTQGTQGGRGYYIDLKHLDKASWTSSGYTEIATLYNQWVDPNAQIPQTLNLAQFSPNGFLPNTLYAVKIAVGPVWKESWHYFLVQ